MVFKRNRIGQLVRITVVELNNEGLINVDSTKVLLKESHEVFKNNLRTDKAFIEAFERKVEMRRMINSGIIPGSGINALVGAGARNQPQNLQQLYQQMGGDYQDPVEEEYERQEELRKKQQLERERK